MSDIGSTLFDTSIVLATCSRAAMLRDALDSLVSQSWDPARGIEIVVVDDLSTDETPQVLAEFVRTSPVPFRVVRGEGRGVAAARNLGIRHAQGIWIASFDDDQIASPHWLRELRRLADATHSACIGGALALALPDGRSPETLGPRVRRILGEHLPSAQPFRYSGNVHPATNNVLFLRELFLEVGGYDTTFTEGGEDKDLFVRFVTAGETLWFQPFSPSLHIMTPRRLERENLRWTAIRVGTSDTRVFQRKQPFLGPLKLSFKRLGAALLRDLPQLLKAKWRHDERAQLDVMISLWHTHGVLRALGPVITARAESSRFLRSMDFRSRNGERSTFTAHTATR